MIPSLEIIAIVAEGASLIEEETNHFRDKPMLVFLTNCQNHRRCQINIPGTSVRIFCNGREIAAFRGSLRVATIALEIVRR